MNEVFNNDVSIRLVVSGFSVDIGRIKCEDVTFFDDRIELTTSDWENVITMPLDCKMEQVEDGYLLRSGRVEVWVTNL